MTRFFVVTLKPRSTFKSLKKPLKTKRNVKLSSPKKQVFPVLRDVHRSAQWRRIVRSSA